MCYSPWDLKESDTTEQLNCTGWIQVLGTSQVMGTGAADLRDS